MSVADDLIAYKPRKINYSSEDDKYVREPRIIVHRRIFKIKFGSIQWPTFLANNDKGAKSSRRNPFYFTVKRISLHNQLKNLKCCSLQRKVFPVKCFKHYSCS